MGQNAVDALLGPPQGAPGVLGVRVCLFPARATSTRGQSHARSLHGECGFPLCNQQVFGGKVFWDKASHFLLYFHQQVFARVDASAADRYHCAAGQVRLSVSITLSPFMSWNSAVRTSLPLMHLLFICVSPSSWLFTVPVGHALLLLESTWSHSLPGH